VIGVFLCMPFARSWMKKYENSIVSNTLLFVIFWYSVYRLSIGINNPFLYFKF
jgi:alginate O-acetyltransferase complex protein AlgI